MAFFCKQKYEKSKHRLGVTWLFISAADVPVRNQVADILFKYKSLPKKERPFQVKVRDCGTGPELAMALASKGIPAYVVDQKGKPLYRATRKPLLEDLICKFLWFLKVV